MSRLLEQVRVLALLRIANVFVRCIECSDTVLFERAEVASLRCRVTYAQLLACLDWRLGYFWGKSNWMPTVIRSVPKHLGVAVYKALGASELASAV